MKIVETEISKKTLLLFEIYCVGLTIFSNEMPISTSGLINTVNSDDKK